MIMHHSKVSSETKVHLHQFHYNTPHVLSYNEGEGAIVPNVPDMTFTKEDLKGVIFPHSDPLVMMVSIDGHEMRKVLIDGGASVNVLYKQAFDRMIIENKVIVAIATPIVGFTGEAIIPEGKVYLPITISNRYGVSRTSIHEFYMVDSSSPYNCILGTKLVGSIGAIPSTLHHSMLFLDEKWQVGRARRCQSTARACHTIYTNHSSSKMSRKNIEITEEGQNRRTRAIISLEPKTFGTGPSTTNGGNRGSRGGDRRGSIGG